MTENNTLCAYAHQAETTNFITNNPCCLVTSDPGTGKTRSVLDAHVKWGGKTLVLAPLSILNTVLPTLKIDKKFLKINH